MRTSFLLLALAAGPALADKHAPFKHGVYREHEKAWARFAIQGIKLGAPLDKQAGFTCGPAAGYDGMVASNHSCVRFTDDRCKGRPTKIHVISTPADTPKGQACFMDENTGSTYLDRQFTMPPITGIQLIGTNTSAPLISQLKYTFAADDLTASSNLGKALIAKYGKPQYSNEPIQMAWTDGDVKLSADCRLVAGEHAAQGDYCTITVEDNKLEQTERSIQQDADDEARKSSAPEPPPL